MNLQGLPDVFGIARAYWHFALGGVWVVGFGWSRVCAFARRKAYGPGGGRK